MKQKVNFSTIVIAESKQHASEIAEKFFFEIVQSPLVSSWRDHTIKVWPVERTLSGYHINVSVYIVYDFDDHE